MNSCVSASVGPWSAGSASTVSVGSGAGPVSVPIGPGSVARAGSGATSGVCEEAESSWRSVECYGVDVAYGVYASAS